MRAGLPLGAVFLPADFVAETLAAGFFVASSFNFASLAGLAVLAGDFGAAPFLTALFPAADFPTAALAAVFLTATFSAGLFPVAAFRGVAFFVAAFFTGFFPVGVARGACFAAAFLAASFLAGAFTGALLARGCRTRGAGVLRGAGGFRARVSGAVRKSIAALAKASVCSIGEICDDFERHKPGALDGASYESPGLRGRRRIISPNNHQHLVSNST